MPTAFDSERLAGRGGGWNFQSHRSSIEGRHLDLGPKRRFGERYGNLDRQVVALAPEQRMVADPNLDE